MNTYGQSPLLEYYVCQQPLNTGVGHSTTQPISSETSWKLSVMNYLNQSCTWCTGTKWANLALHICKGQDEKNCHGSRTPSPTEPTSKRQRVQPNRRATIAKRMEISKNLEHSQKAEVSVQTSPVALTKSKRGRASEKSRNYIQKLFFDMEAECSDCDSTIDLPEKPLRKSGCSGGLPVQEKQEECGSSPIPMNCGYTRERGGSTDTMDTQLSSSTISTEAGSSFHTSSSF
ncbi:putative replication protein [uncultured virus]|uniref:Putative replication protein n=1 Tax=uncultured virus TaxID=340016 RepID=A0A1I9XGD3_9VIRU|nr:putative replication protein [uncultured virus]